MHRTKKPHRLTLSPETIRTLTNPDLGIVHGGAVNTGGASCVATCYTCEGQTCWRTCGTC